MECRQWWPLCSCRRCKYYPHYAAALQAAANSLDGIIDTVAVKHPLADYLNLLKVCCSPCMGSTCNCSTLAWHLLLCGSAEQLSSPLAWH